MVLSAKRMGGARWACCWLLTAGCGLVTGADAGEAPPGDGGSPPPAPIADGSWLLPLARVVADPLRQQPEVIAAELELQRTRQLLIQAQSRWSPQLTLNSGFDENRRLSRSVIDGTGTVVDRTTDAAASVSKEFATGTRVELRTDTASSDSTSAQRLDNPLYDSAVRVVITQALLEGASRSANLLEEARAIDLYADDDDRFRDQLELQFSGLAELWISLAQRRNEVVTRRTGLEQARDNLARAEERVAQGLGRFRDVLARRRDVVAQEAALKVAERALATDSERLALSWPTLVHPDGSGLPGSEVLDQAPRTVGISSRDWADSRRGRAALRQAAAAARDYAASRNAARDQLDLSLSYGKNGTATTWGETWDRLGTEDTYRWSAGLTWVHRFGADRDRAEAVRAGLAVEQSRQNALADARAWRLDRAILRQALLDAMARVGENERLLEAYREELRLQRAEADEGLIPVNDVLDSERSVIDTELAVRQAGFDVLRADLELRAQDDSLLEALP